MTRDHDAAAEPVDDDALQWAGDEIEAAQVADRAAHGLEASGVTALEGEAGPRPMSSVLLVLHGVIAGVYLLYTVGWVIAIMRDPYSRPTLLAEIMAQFGEFLAIAAPLVWMVVTLALTRGRNGARLGWLAAGIVLLVPLPFVLGV